MVNFIDSPDISVRTEHKSGVNGLPLAQQNRVAAAGRKYRVLMAITVLGTGGATNVVLDIAEHFNQHPDFEIDLITGPIPEGRTDLTYIAQDRGIRTREVPNLVNHINPLTNLKAVADLRRMILKGQYDVVHSHSSVAGVVARMAAMSAGVPVILHHVHGWGIHQVMPWWTRALYLALEWLCARFTSRLIMVSRRDIQKGLDYHIDKAEKFSLIYNGIDLSRFRKEVDEQRVRSELGLDADTKLVGMIGRLDEQKNPLDFIRAAAMVTEAYPQAQFVFIGDGPLRADCESLIDELGMRGRFFLLGFRDDIERILPIITITALSSLWEGLPLVFLESMSVGKPIVANDVDGAREVVINGETGFLVTPRQPAEMAERILYLLRNEAQCSQMGETALRRSEYFSVQRMVEQVESLYKELLTA